MPRCLPRTRIEDTVAHPSSDRRSRRRRTDTRRAACRLERIRDGRPRRRAYAARDARGAVRGERAPDRPSPGRPGTPTRSRARSAARAGENEHDGDAAPSPAWRVRACRGERRFLRPQDRGENENNQVVDGEWWKGTLIADSPFADSSRKVAHAIRTSMWTGHPLIGYRFAFDGVVILPHDTLALTALNAVPRAPDGVALFTARYRTLPNPGDLGAIARRCAACRAWRARRHAALRPRRPFAKRRVARGIRIARSPRRQDRSRRDAEGRTTHHAANAAARAARGRLAAPHNRWRERRGTGGRRGGRRAAQRRRSESAHRDRVQPRQRRALLGDGRRPLEIERGNRPPSSSATSCASSARIRPLNFDGGGSTTMVVRDRIVNSPSDSVGERPVGDALVLVRRARSGAQFPALDSARLIADGHLGARRRLDGRAQDRHAGRRTCAEVPARRARADRACAGEATNFRRAIRREDADWRNSPA